MSWVLGLNSAGDGRAVITVHRARQTAAYRCLLPRRGGARPFITVVGSATRSTCHGSPRGNGGTATCPASARRSSTVVWRVGVSRG
jgi:hypothetical protein